MSSAETERMAALHALLRPGSLLVESKTVPLLDRLTELGSQLFGTPICCITLVEKERQYFIGRAGLSVRATPREMSFCTHGIMPDAPTPFVVADTWKDSRFVNNPLVVDDIKIRFYAGSPLIHRETRQPVGMLCIISDKPRQLSAEEGAQLAAAADVVMDYLEQLSATPARALETPSIDDALERLSTRAAATPPATTPAAAARAADAPPAATPAATAPPATTASAASTAQQGHGNEQRLPCGTVETIPTLANAADFLEHGCGVAAVPKQLASTTPAVAAPTVATSSIAVSSLAPQLGKRTRVMLLPPMQPPVAVKCPGWCDLRVDIDHLRVVLHDALSHLGAPLKRPTTDDGFSFSFHLCAGLPEALHIVVSLFSAERTDGIDLKVRRLKGDTFVFHRFLRDLQTQLWLGLPEVPPEKLSCRR